MLVAAHKDPGEESERRTRECGDSKTSLGREMERRECFEVHSDSRVRGGIGSDPWLLASPVPYIHGILMQ